MTSTNSLQSYYEKWHVLWYSTYYIGKYLQFKEFEHKVDEYFIYILYCQFCKDFCVSAMENVIQHFLDFNMNIIYITTIMCSVISEEIWNTLFEMHSLYFLIVLAKHNLSKKSSSKGNGRIIMQYGWLFFFSIPSMNWTQSYQFLQQRISYIVKFSQNYSIAKNALNHNPHWYCKMLHFKLASYSNFFRPLL